MTGHEIALEGAEGEGEGPGYRQVGPVRIRRDASFGPIVLVLVSLAGVLAVLWGQLFAAPGINVTQFDAGSLDHFAIGEVVVFEDLDLYIVGLEDGRIRAVDGRVDGSECSVAYLPGDWRGRAQNPNGVTGVLEDACSGAVWSVAGDAISGSDKPLRTPQVTFRRDDAGALHVWVELITLDVTAGE